MGAPVDVRQWLSDERFMYGLGTESRAKCEEAYAAVAELIEAANTYATRYCMDEAGEDGPEWTGCSKQQHEDAVALFAALARCKAVQP